jgi:hypothetical protein
MYISFRTANVYNIYTKVLTPKVNNKEHKFVHLVQLGKKRSNGCCSPVFAF